ncbi:MAG: M1 family metallopeptidase [Acidobacteriaceae bacterium]|nr:M1 family metallopeptidase [Acidobacteriaceae bacterium]
MKLALCLAACALCSAVALAQGSTAVTNTTPGSASAAQRARALDVLKPPTADDLLRGPYGTYRANNDLLSYKLDVRVDPVAQTIKGVNTVRFRMLKDGSRIQLDLTPELAVDSATMDGKALKVSRDLRAVFIDTPEAMRKGKVYAVAVAWSGKPVKQGRFGCFSFDKDKEGKPWITTACEEEGASTWWPNKDQWKDEPQEGMEINVSVPNGLMDVSNGRFVGSKDLGDGYTEWKWKVSYGINNYDVALNIGEYVHWSLPKHGETTLDFYVLPENLEKSKVQFAQVPEMLEAYEHYFGEYPFVRDGYKLVDVPYAGMEHQSAVAYGNRYANGYYGRDWTGAGISTKFDFIIIHESGHEWFGNAVTAADKCDMWIHEGWTTYMELLYVEYRWGKGDMLRYANGLKPKVHNERPVIPPCGVNAEPPQDQYFKGALMINTLRSLVGDDAKWFADIHDFYQQFKYQQITTAQVEDWWSKRTGMMLKPFFDEYLRHATMPVLELKFADGKVSYRYKAEEAKFAMPVKVGEAAHWNVVTPVVGEWKWMPWTKGKDAFAVDTDEYFVDVVKE